MQASRFHIHSSKPFHPLIMNIVVYSYDFHHVVSRNMEAVKEEKPPNKLSFHRTQERRKLQIHLEYSFEQEFIRDQRR
ncbi:hypothetical protein ACB092_08G009000 [Castanea dentata]